MRDIIWWISLFKKFKFDFENLITYLFIPNHVRKIKRSIININKYWISIKLSLKILRLLSTLLFLRNEKYS